MFVLIVVTVMMEVNGPQLATRPEIEYYTSIEQCQKYGVNHIKEFLATLPKEPALIAAKCVKVGKMDGDPA